MAWLFCSEFTPAFRPATLGPTRHTHLRGACTVSRSLWIRAFRSDLPLQRLCPVILRLFSAPAPFPAPIALILATSFLRCQQVISPDFTRCGFARCSPVQRNAGTAMTTAAPATRVMGPRCCWSRSAGSQTQASAANSRPWGHRYPRFQASVLNRASRTPLMAFVHGEVRKRCYGA